jgi:diguanylate cyclase (GGDEF)-like protein
MKPKLLPTIRSRLIMLVLACIVPASLMVVGLISYTYHQDRKQLIQGSMATVRAMMSAVDKDLAGVKTALLTLATSPHLTSNDLSAFYEQAQEVLQIQQANNILLIDPTFQQRLNTLRPFGSELPSITNPTIQQVFKTGQPVVTDLYLGNVAKQPIIAIAVPIFRNGKVAYVLAAAILSQRLSELLSQQRFSDGWVGAILDGTGTIVGRTRQMERFVGTKANPELIARMAEVAEDSLDSTTVDGVPVLSIFNRSTVSNWTVVIGIPSKVLINEVVYSLWWLVAGMLVLVLSSLALAWVIGSTISTSIQRLAAPALALGSGEAVTVPSLRFMETDEVGRALTRASQLLMASQHRANHDPLTGLANRALFDEILGHQLAICKRTKTNLSLAFIDLDGFKPVNDVHGHATGDDLLRMVAARLKTSIRESDLAARLGGDEFAVVFLHSGSESSQTIAAKLIGNLSAPYAIGSLTLVISASVGIAGYPEAGTSSEALSAHADAAMYDAKAVGRRQLASAS